MTLQFLDATGTLQAVLPLEPEVLAVLASYFAADAGPSPLARLGADDSEIVWGRDETAALRRQVARLLSLLPRDAKGSGARARDFLWRFEQFLHRAELESLQVRARAENETGG